MLQINPTLGPHLAWKLEHPYRSNRQNSIPFLYEVTLRNAPITSENAPYEHTENNTRDTLPAKRETHHKTTSRTWARPKHSAVLYNTVETLCKIASVFGTRKRSGAYHEKRVVWSVGHRMERWLLFQRRAPLSENCSFDSSPHGTVYPQIHE